VTKPVLTLCGTYTLDPAAEAVGFWLEFLGLDATVHMAPYAQVFQQLLDPGSAVRSNRSGANVVLVRWADLLRRGADGAGDPDGDQVERQVAELGSALTAFDHQVPCLVLIGPCDRHAPVLQRATAQLESLLAGTPNLSVETGDSTMQRYGVDHVHDAASDRFGHVPFTSQAMTVLGTRIARWYAAQVRAPIKVIGVDGDHTLWAGVVAEDGVEGVRISEGHAALQRELVAQSNGGRLLCLLSKNEEADVRRVFERQPPMPLQWSHLVAHRVDWNPKPDNLAAMVSELELSLDSVVFLDDNPMECAQMRARCPSVTTVRVPTEPEQLRTFVDHLWLFDRVGATAEDLRRARMYVDNIARTQLRRSADSLQAFIDRLELLVEIEPPSPAQVVRLAQLTQRTNQFNASLIRCDQHEIARTTAQGSVFHRYVRAEDRFGDYGIVGQIRGRADAGRLVVDLFMLSCRALGRGIEHRMVAAAGAHALSVGLEEVVLLFRHGERNAPVAGFLAEVFGVAESAAGSEDLWYRLPAGAAAGVAFNASAIIGHDDPSTPGLSHAADTPGKAISPAAERADIGAVFEHIAIALNTGARIEQAMARRRRPRADLASGYIEPAPGLEREIAAIWQDVLLVDKVGSQDRFQDLGGKSVHLVKVHGLLLERLGVELDITALFQHPTVASLATHLGVHSDGRVTDAARLRGLRMRAARSRAAGRAGVGS